MRWRGRWGSNRARPGCVAAGMAEPKQPTEPDASENPEHVVNPTGETPHGVRHGDAGHEPLAWPSSDRNETETAVQKAGKP